MPLQGATERIPFSSRLYVPDKEGERVGTIGCQTIGWWSTEKGDVGLKWPSTRIHGVVDLYGGQ
jgi:hypothetical protein